MNASQPMAGTGDTVTDVFKRLQKKNAEASVMPTSDMGMAAKDVELDFFDKPVVAVVDATGDGASAVVDGSASLLSRGTRALSVATREIGDTATDAANGLRKAVVSTSTALIGVPAPAPAVVPAPAADPMLSGAHTRAPSGSSQSNVVKYAKAYTVNTTAHVNTVSDNDDATVATFHVPGDVFSQRRVLHFDQQPSGAKCPGAKAVPHTIQLTTKASVLKPDGTMVPLPQPLHLSLEEPARAHQYPSGLSDYANLCVTKSGAHAHTVTQGHGEIKYTVPAVVKHPMTGGTIKGERAVSQSSCVYSDTPGNDALVWKDSIMHKYATGTELGTELSGARTVDVNNRSAFEVPEKAIKASLLKIHRAYCKDHPVDDLCVNGLTGVWTAPTDSGMMTAHALLEPYPSGSRLLIDTNVRVGMMERVPAGSQ